MCVVQAGKRVAGHWSRFWTQHNGRSIDGLPGLQLPGRENNYFYTPTSTTSSSTEGGKALTVG